MTPNDDIHMGEEKYNSLLETKYPKRVEYAEFGFSWIPEFYRN